MPVNEYMRQIAASARRASYLRRNAARGRALTRGLSSSGGGSARGRGRSGGSMSGS